MGHKWGQGVPDYGLGGIAATLAARSLLDARQIVCNGHQLHHGGWVLAVLPLLADLPYQLLPMVFTPGFETFPYGIPVEADAPV